MKHIPLDTKYIAGGTIALIIIVAGSFYAGTAYASAHRPSGHSAFAAGQFTPGAARIGGARGGAFATGQIIAKDATSITIKMQDGSTKIILFGTSTQVMKTAAGSIDDLAIGTNVLVTGPANADGSVTAQSVSIRPPMPQPAQ